ncbi:MAG: potassium transporter Trk, partial [Ruthenibacterium sp.]
MEPLSLAKALALSAQRKHRNPTKIIVASFMAVILCGGILLTLPISARDGVSVGFLGALFT